MTHAAPKPGKPIWPRIPPGFVRAVLAGHSSLGLAFAVLIYVVCFSGTVAVFAREFQRWERPDMAPITSVTPQVIERVALAAIAHGRNVEHVFINTPSPDYPRLVVTVDDDGPNRTWLAGADGRLMGSGETVWTEFLTALHINLHLPRTWGEFIVGLTGVALLSSLISGVLAHPRIFKDAFHLRWGGSKRLQEADLHNRLGVWAMPFHVIVSTTGALLGLTTVIVGALALAVFQGDMDKAYALFLPPHPVDDPRPALASPRVAHAVEQALARSPGGRVSFIVLEHPTERGAGVSVSIAQPNRLAATDSYTFEGGGRLISAERMDEASLGLKILNSLGVLHFGWFGGGLIKIAYGLLGLALCAVTSSGVAIWLARRRDKGRPAPRWERLWIAAVWGQPFALAGSAFVGVLAASPILPLAVWIALTVAAGLGTAWLSAASLSRSLRMASGALMLATAALWTLRRFQNVEDPMAWVVTGTIAATGAILLAQALRKPALARAELMAQSGA
jgi:uncharacterized iron-regulated membrane protein